MISTAVFPGSMHSTSQIIDRNLHRRAHCDTGMWINPEKDAGWCKAANSCTSLKLFCQEYGAFIFHQRAGADVRFAAFPGEKKEVYDWIILNLPRQKALLRMLLDCAAGLLADDGVLWLAGENKAGIKSADKILRSCFADVNKLDNARHCTLYQAKSPLQRHSFSHLTYQQKWLLNYSGGEIRVASYPGVFAHGRLDDGTALLLDTLAGMSFSGDILDFGCGAGVIGVCIAASNKDARVTFLDSSALALKACEETLAANQLSGSALASDGLSELRHSYDLVISNPPIHAGVKTDTGLSLQLLETVHQHIKPGGRLILVANRHLPYENWLSKNFRPVNELAANRNFKVIAAEKYIRKAPNDILASA